MGSHCICRAVKQHLCWAGIRSSLLELFWWRWQLRRASCAMLAGAPSPCGSGGPAPLPALPAGGRMCRGRSGAAAHLVALLTSFCRCGLLSHRGARGFPGWGAAARGAQQCRAALGHPGAVAGGTEPSRRQHGPCAQSIASQGACLRCTSACIWRRCLFTHTHAIQV